MNGNENFSEHFRRGGEPKCAPLFAVIRLKARRAVKPNVRPLETCLKIIKAIQNITEIEWRKGWRSPATAQRWGRWLGFPAKCLPRSGPSRRNCGYLCGYFKNQNIFIIVISISYSDDTARSCGTTDLANFQRLLTDAR
jgi:hypothetical protein